MISAELRRNLWLEISHIRLVIIPVVLVLIFWCLGILRSPIDFQMLSGAALAMFALICILWGSQLVAGSITEEAQAQTWDWQRLSSQTSAELMIGKLFGSTVLAWYGGAWCLAAYLVFSVIDGHLPSASWLVLSIAGAIFIHAGTMLMTLGIPPDQRPVHQQKRGVGALRLLVIILVLQSIFGMGSFLYKSNASAQWYGFNITLMNFIAGSTILWAAWAVFGCVQRLSTLLRSPTTPTPWLVFVVWCMFYIAGFSRGLAAAIGTKDSVSEAGYFSLTAYLVALGLTLALVLQEDKSPVYWRMWFTALRNKQNWLAWQRTPRWVATLAPLFVALCFSISATSALSPWLLIAPMLLLLRDVAVLYSFYWTPERTRPQLAFSIYLLVVYLLIPYLLSPVKPFLYPSEENPAISLLGFGAEAMLAALFCVRRWKKYYAQ